MATVTKGLLTAVEEESMIKSRFLTGASVSRGDPPLKRLAKRFVQLADEAEGGSEANVQEQLRHLLREIYLIELQGAKLKAICDANVREQEGYQLKQQQLEADIEQVRRDIESKKDELKAAKVERQHHEQYEVLRGIAMEMPTRSHTLGQIARVEASIGNFDQEGAKSQLILEKRRKDLALLFHTLEELKRVGEDDAAGDS